MNLNEIGDLIEEELNDKDSVRELAIKSSRAIIRLASQSIMKIHRGENYEEDLRKIKEEVWHIRSLLLKEHPDLFYAGFVQNALQEYCEATVFSSLMKSNDFPSPKELNVNPEAYIMGLGDVVGELRREVLESLRSGDFEFSEKYLQIMEDIYQMLMRFNYPSGLVPIKQKQDIARNLIEKTRSEITIAQMNRKLQQKIESIEEKL